MQLQHTDRVNAFVARLKAEHLTQSDPNVQARVLVLASEYFDAPSIVEDSGKVPMSRRALGLVPDGVVSGVAHAPVLVGNATAPKFVEPPPSFTPKSLLTEQEELAGHTLSEGSGTGRYPEHDNWIDGASYGVAGNFPPGTGSDGQPLKPFVPFTQAGIGPDGQPDLRPKPDGPGIVPLAPPSNDFALEQTESQTEQVPTVETQIPAQE
jgi:hypothetical protein